MRIYPFVFTGNDPRKGWRIPLNEIKYNEQRDEETGYGYFGARYMDHELMTMWLSVDPMSDKYPSISPYAYCAWNPVKLVDPNGKDIYRLDVSTGSLKLYQKTKDKHDRIVAGSYQGIGRAKTKSEKQIEQLKSQLPDASRKERQKIEQKIKNITQNAKKKESGEEHSRVNKR